MRNIVFFRRAITAFFLWECFLLPAQDKLFSDFVPSEPERLEVLTPSGSDRTSSDSLLLFGKAFSPLLFQGKATEKDLDRMLAVLESNPDSRVLTAFYVNMIPEKNVFHDAGIDKFCTLAEKHPESEALNLTAAELRITQKKTNEALKILRRVFPVLLSGTAPINPDAANFRRTILSKYLMLCMLSGEKKELAQAVEKLKNSSYRDDPVFVSCLVILSGAEMEKDGRIFVTPLGPLPGKDIRKLRNFYLESEHFLTLLRQGKMIRTPHRDAAVNALAIAGRAEETYLALLEQMISTPDDPELFLSLAKIRLSQKKPLTAARLAEKILDIDKNAPPGAYLSVAEGYARAGDSDRAAAVLRRLRERVPETAPVDEQLTMLYLRAGKYAEAMTVISGLPEGFDRSYFEAMALESQKNYPAARAAADRAAAFAEKNNLRFTDTNFYLFRAGLADKMNDLAAIESILKPVLVAFPGDPGALNFLGYTYAERNIHLPEALQMISSANAALPNNPAILDSMAWIHHRLKKHADAKKYILLALEKSGNLPDGVLLDHAGDIFFASGDSARALEYWREALESGSEDIKPDQIETKIKNAVSSMNKQ